MQVVSSDRNWTGVADADASAGRFACAGNLAFRIPVGRSTRNWFRMSGAPGCLREPASGRAYPTAQALAITSVGGVIQAPADHRFPIIDNLSRRACTDINVQGKVYDVTEFLDGALSNLICLWDVIAHRAV